MKKYIFSFLILLNLVACDKPSNELKNGIWRGTLMTKAGVEIPFNFEIKDSLSYKVIDIINGNNKLRVNDIEQVEDSLFIKLPFFDTEIRCSLIDNAMQGIFVRNTGNQNSAMDFNAKYDIGWRIKENVTPAKHQISGKWETYFVSQDKDSTLAIGNFTQNNNNVTGTFITRTGDYRFLDGIIDGDSLTLSTFDGGFAMLFTAKINSDSSITNGKFYSGFSSVKDFDAKRNDSIKLVDPYSLTYLKEGFKTIEFSFPDVNKKQVSLTDDRFKNKVTIIQILGSWCPNCIDESIYLTQLKNKNKDLEIVGLAYERTADFEKSKKAINNLAKRLNIPYPILITGYSAEKGEPAKSLPMLNHIMAFPTTIILDKKGLVRKIHTGFTGPSSGKYYEDYIKTFENEIETLQSE